MVENARKVFFFLGIQSVRLTPNVRGIGEGVAFCVSNWIVESCGEGNDWEQVSTSQSTRGR